jgi:hypothetical protein
MSENKQDLTEDRAQIIEKAKQEGMLSACFMSFTVLVLYVADFSQNFKKSIAGRR